MAEKMFLADKKTLDEINKNTNIIKEMLILLKNSSLLVVE